MLPGYTRWDPNEVLYRERLQATAEITLGGITTGEVVLNENTRRVQILSDGHVLVGDSVTCAGAVPAEIVAGNWIEIPPTCDRLIVTPALVAGTVYITALRGMTAAEARQGRTP